MVDITADQILPAKRQPANSVRPIKPRPPTYPPQPAGWRSDRPALPALPALAEGPDQPPPQEPGEDEGGADFAVTAVSQPLLLGSKTRQLAQLVDALGAAIAQMRSDSRREIQVLRDHLTHERDEHRRELVASEGRLVELRAAQEERLDDLRGQLETVRQERDQLRGRIRELEYAKDGLMAQMLGERRRGWLGRLFAR